MLLLHFVWLVYCCCVFLLLCFLLLQFFYCCVIVVIFFLLNCVYCCCILFGFVFCCYIFLLLFLLLLNFFIVAFIDYILFDCGWNAWRVLHVGLNTKNMEITSQRHDSQVVKKGSGAGVSRQETGNRSTTRQLVHVLWSRPARIVTEAESIGKDCHRDTLCCRMWVCEGHHLWTGCRASRHPNPKLIGAVAV